MCIKIIGFTDGFFCHKSALEYYKNYEQIKHVKVETCLNGLDDFRNLCIVMFSYEEGVNCYNYVMHRFNESYSENPPICIKSSDNKVKKNYTIMLNGCKDDESITQSSEKIVFVTRNTNVFSLLEICL